jgi:hypothetical protein
MTKPQDESLTEVERRIRDRCKHAPAHIRRSIDAHRIAHGMPPLWRRRKAATSPKSATS